MLIQVGKFHRLRCIYTGMCLILTPAITVILTIMSIYEESDILVLQIIPVFLIVWGISLIGGVIAALVNHFYNHRQNDCKKTIFYSMSFGLFLGCSFIELFSKSVILGGFHAS